MSIELNNYTVARNTDTSNSSAASKSSSNLLSSNSLSMQDFFSLMVAELSNQDMYNTVDNTQYISQLAQFSMMQAVSDLSETFAKSFSDLSLAYSTSYGVSLIGKEVTLAQSDSSGQLYVHKGIVESVNLFNGNAEIVVDGKGYAMSSVMEVKEPNIIIPDDIIREIETRTDVIEESNDSVIEEDSSNGSTDVSGIVEISNDNDTANSDDIVSSDGLEGGADGE